jgi:hypothetical protein
MLRTVLDVLTRLELLGRTRTRQADAARCVYATGGIFRDWNLTAADQMHGVRWSPPAGLPETDI